MERRRYLVTYDISDDKRRDQVFQTLRDNGDHAQYSVFFCELTPRELVS
jgi:CRISPR-associated protein Cas2